MSVWALIMIPGAPWAVALLLAVGRRHLTRAAGPLAVAGLSISLVLLIALSGAPEPRVAMQWAFTGGLWLDVGMRLDALARYMAFFVTGIAWLVTLYACGYLAADRERSRFFALFMFFAGAMLVLVLADSLLLLFAAWEWVGLTSFLLIGYRYHETASQDAACKAFLMTRLADMGFLLGWLWALHLAHTTNIPRFLEMVQSGSLASGAAGAIAFLLLVGALGKSAQLPLSAWLPPAMAGPTPVSALIHSATMVAAGIYLILRLFPLFARIAWVLNIMLWGGAITALFAALAALSQTDLKRVLAWSTISQLGEMMLTLGLAAPLAALYHLSTHGLFKSALFLSAGTVDHATGTRNLERLGGLKTKLPLASLVFAAAGLSLAGAPFFSGFFSEERILTTAVQHFPAAILIIILVFLAAAYISRAWTATFAYWPQAPEPDARPQNLSMTIGMLGLALPAVGFGWLLSRHLSQWVPFDELGELDFGWKVAAILAWAAGSILGFRQVRQKGPFPAPGAWGQRLAAGLNLWTVLRPMRVVLCVCEGIQYIEMLLDTRVVRLRAAMLQAAARFNRIEDHLDHLAAGVAGYVFKLALGSDRIETRSISDGLNAKLSLLARAGDFITAIQSGKLYAYTMLLFVWVAGLALLGWVLWIG